METTKKYSVVLDHSGIYAVRETNQTTDADMVLSRHDDLGIATETANDATHVLRTIRQQEAQS